MDSKDGKSLPLRSQNTKVWYRKMCS